MVHDRKKIQIKDIPVMPQVAGKILHMQEENLEISFKELEKIILVGPALTAKILKFQIQHFIHEKEK